MNNIDDVIAQAKGTDDTPDKYARMIDIGEAINQAKQIDIIPDKYRIMGIDKGNNIPGTSLHEKMVLVEIPGNGKPKYGWLPKNNFSEGDLEGKPHIHCQQCDIQLGYYMKGRPMMD